MPQRRKSNSLISRPPPDHVQEMVEGIRYPRIRHLSERVESVRDCVVLLGAVMILLMLYVAIVAAPPVGEALRNTVFPEQVDFLVITTLVGGTVGGYITYAGTHRMIDSGIRGERAIKQISRTSVLSIIVTAVMRTLLFLAIFGVVAGGVRRRVRQDVAEPVDRGEAPLLLTAGRQAEGVRVEGPLARGTRLVGDPVVAAQLAGGVDMGLLGVLVDQKRHQPTAPSICSSMRRLSSRAYSIGSSLAIGSTKPRTIIAIASSSSMPRDIR